MVKLKDIKILKEHFYPQKSHLYITVLSYILGIIKINNFL
jgi:hypothetical protein